MLPVIEIEIKGLHKRIDACNKQIFTLRHLPTLVSNMASFGLTGLHIIAKKVGVISQIVLDGIKAACSVAGAAAGESAVILGGIESFLGIRGAVQAYKEKKLVEAKIEKFAELSRPENGIPDHIWEIMRKARGLQLGREGLNANKNFQLSVLKACGGTLATIAGALGIAAAFTTGAAATGIAIAAIVIGMIGP
jgi:hypothetical protein